MSAPVDRERIAEILSDAFALGDAPAARKWRCSTRTIRRYRETLRAEPELAAIVREKRRGTQAELSTLRVRFLRRALRVLEKKIHAPEATLYEIAGAVKIVGELHQIAQELDDERSDGPGPEDSEAESGAGAQGAATH